MGEEFVESIIESLEVDKSADEITADIGTEKEPTKVEPEPEPKPEPVADPEPEPAKVTPTVEELAEQIGWNKDYEGSEKVDAATYILRSREIQDTMRDNSKDLKNQLSSLEGAVDALKVHNEKVYKADVKRLEDELVELKKEKRAAVELADVDKVDELDAKIDGVQKDLSAPKPAEPKTTSDNPAYDAWVAENKWYESDDEMAAYADTVADQYKGAPAQRIYALISQKVKEVFPDKFESPKAEPTPKVDDLIKEPEKPPVGPTSPVESSSSRVNETTFTENDLTADQRAIMNQFAQRGIMTKEAYIADIAKLQEV